MRLVANFVFLYHVIRASENLLAVALRESPRGPIRSYFARHLEEERGHAKWLARDLLEGAGIEVKRTKLPRQALEMVGAVYYLIYHVDPIALLGYMQALEAQAVTAEQLEELEREHPPELLRTLKHHAKEDPAHLAAIEAIVARLSPGKRALVEQTRQMTLEYLRAAAAALPTMFS